MKKPTAHNVLTIGQDGDFRLCTLSRDLAQVDGVVVGVFYKAMVLHIPDGNYEHPDRMTEQGVGVNPHLAVEHAMGKIDKRLEPRKVIEVSEEVMGILRARYNSGDKVGDLAREFSLPHQKVSDIVGYRESHPRRSEGKRSSKKAGKSNPDEEKGNVPDQK